MTQQTIERNKQALVCIDQKFEQLAVKSEAIDIKLSNLDRMQAAEDFMLLMRLAWALRPYLATVPNHNNPEALRGCILGQLANALRLPIRRDLDDTDRDFGQLA